MPWSGSPLRLVRGSASLGHEGKLLDLNLVESVMELGNTGIAAGENLRGVRFEVIANSDKGVVDSVEETAKAFLAEQGVLALASGAEALLTVMVESGDNKNCPLHHGSGFLNEVAEGVGAKGPFGGHDGHLLSNLAEEVGDLDDAVVQITARLVSARNSVGESHGTFVGAAELEVILVVRMHLKTADLARRSHLAEES